MNRKIICAPWRIIKYVISLLTTRTWAIFAFAYTLVVRYAAPTWMVEHPEEYMLTLFALCAASVLYVIVSPLLLNTRRGKCKSE